LLTPIVESTYLLYYKLSLHPIHVKSTVH